MNREPMSLDEIGVLLVQAAKTVPLNQRGSFADVMKSFHTPVGQLRRKK